MNDSTQKGNIVPIVIIGMMFFVFGFATWINAMLIPYFRIACELSNLQAYFVTFAFYISYLLMSVPASYLLKKQGFKRGMMTGFWVMAAGAFVFIPAALSRAYGIFLIGLFLIGIGLASCKRRPIPTLRFSARRTARHNGSASWASAIKARASSLLCCSPQSFSGPATRRFSKYKKDKPENILS